MDAFDDDDLTMEEDLTVPAAAAAAAAPSSTAAATHSASASAAASSSSSAAAAAAAAAPDGAHSLECPSCRCLYTDPLSLSCSHTMCLSCCRHWAATSSEIQAASIDSDLAMFGVTDADFLAIHGGKPVEGRSMDTKQLGVPRFMDRVVDWSARCHICMGVAKPYKDLVICDRCDLAVHESCYGIDNLSDESDAEWFCDPCKEARQNGGALIHPPARNAGHRSVEAYNAKENYRKQGAGAAAASSSSSAAAAAAAPSARARKQQQQQPGGKKKLGAATSARCCVCSNTSDLALYPVEGGGWIHVSCALFLEGPDGCGHEDDNLVRGVDDIGPQWFRLQCAFCDEPGATVQCKYGKCLKAYHVPCGIRYGALFTNKLVKGESGRSCDNICYRDSVCPLHRKHMESVANAHDPRIKAAQRKAKQQKGRKNKGKQTAMPCPVCRKVTHLSLTRPNLGLPPAADLRARADAHRLAHPEEEEDLNELMSKYKSSRPHDSSSDSDDDEEEANQPTRAAASSSSSAAAAAAAAVAPVRSRSGVSATARTSTHRSPCRSAPTAAPAAAASAASRSPARARAVHTPVESTLSPSSLTSSRPSRVVRQRSTSPPSAPLTPSKRKTSASVAAAAAPTAPASAPRRRPSSVLAAQLNSSFSDVGDADDDDDDDAEMNELQHLTSSSSSSAAAAPSLPPRMLRCHSEPAHATSAASSSAAAAAAAAAAAGSSPSSSVHPQPATPSSTPFSGIEALRARHPLAATSAAASSTVTGGSGSSGRSTSSRATRGGTRSSVFNCNLSLDIDGLEILDCKLSGAAAAGGRPSQARKKLRLTTAEAQQHANATRGSQHAPVAAAAAAAASSSAAPSRARSNSHSAAAAAAASSFLAPSSFAAAAAEDESGDRDDDLDAAGDDDDGADDGDEDVAEQVSHEQDVLMRLESLDSSIREQFAVLMPAQNKALLHPELRNRLSNLRATLREQYGLVQNGLRAPTRDRVPTVLASLEQSLSLLMRAYLGDAAPTRRVSVRHPKVGLVQELDHLVGGLIDPMLAHTGARAR